MTKPATVQDILEDVPADSPRWKEFNYLADKEIKDLAAGKGFRRQLLTEAADKCGTIGRHYNKCRSTEPFLIHPENDKLSRLFTPKEHARLKGIPDGIVKGISDTIAHQILGQSVIWPVFQAVGKQIGEFIFASCEDSMKPVLMAA